MLAKGKHRNAENTGEIALALARTGHPGPNNGMLGPVANVAALAALDTTNLADGISVWVRTFRSWFTLDRADVEVPNSVTIVAAGGTGGGNWLRIATQDIFWAQTTTWFFDETNGNEENAGNLVGVPVKTLGEILRRVAAYGQWTINLNSVTVTQIGDAPANTDLQTLNVRLRRGANLFLKSDAFKTFAAAAALTASTLLNRATDTLNQIQGPNINANCVGKLLFNSTLNSYAWGVAFSAPNLTISQSYVMPALGSNILLGAGVPTVSAWAIGNQVAVLDAPNCNIQNITVDAESDGATPDPGSVYVYGFTFVDPSASGLGTRIYSANNILGNGVNFQNCRWNVPAAGEGPVAPVYENCFFASAGFIGALVSGCFIGGYAKGVQFSGGMNAANGCPGTYLDGDIILDNNCNIEATRCILGRVAILGNRIVDLVDGAVCPVFPVNYASAIIYGPAGFRLRVQGTVQVVTGTVAAAFPTLAQFEIDNQTGGTTYNSTTNVFATQATLSPAVVDAADGSTVGSRNIMTGHSVGIH